jgi:hypothetical protein
LSLINRRVIKWCYKEVYSSLPEEWIDTAVQGEKFDPCFGHYGTLQDMIDNHALPAIMPDGSQNGHILIICAGLRAGAKVDVVGI